MAEEWGQRNGRKGGRPGHPSVRALGLSTDMGFGSRSAPTSMPDESTAIASLTADFDQTTWDTLSIRDTGTVIFDEIRFGTSYAAVTGVPEPTRALLLAVALASMALRRRR